MDIGVLQAFPLRDPADRDDLMRVLEEAKADRLQETYALLRQAKENGTIRTGFPPLDRPGISHKPRKGGKKKRK